MFTECIAQAAFFNLLNTTFFWFCDVAPKKREIDGALLLASDDSQLLTERDNTQLRFGSSNKYEVGQLVHWAIQEVLHWDVIPLFGPSIWVTEKKKERWMELDI